ncbi:MAG: pyruvate ferredoxin oxidoreductase [Candidatus Diapherotrites archaeon]|uniref:Pyruvate ferredoxin oxidoreductase n=2 Tax=Candidatus Iainarchaeum sp. TaxID=3101447 RepID=A0A8T4KZX6_9ARCH|nr:MAG: pyruvate ferredoxin oxidoreductase, alpha subunit [archaeon GW2011_AR10]MBS3059787.1 pyruvate ferredoxin oxidoreductase [Candidatus Diapherotrites archaeon]
MVLVTREGAIALGDVAVNCGVEVCACYPITPTTHLTEELNKRYADGEIPEYITVESEFAAISALVGASATGARTFTTTGGQGLLLMHEVLHSAAGMRLPIVMVVGNRAVSSPLNIWNDEQDTVSQRDTGWIQIYCKNNQEAADSLPQAFKIAETVMLPTMVCIDGHFLTHAVEQIDLIPVQELKKFLPKFRHPLKLDPENPVSVGVYANPAHYQTFREDLVKDMEESTKVINDVGSEFGKMFGRSYGLVNAYKCKDADRVLVGLGSVMDNVFAVVDELRAKGEKVGGLHLRVFRPFPAKELRKALEGKKVGMIERNLSIGASAPVYTELMEAMSGSKTIISSFFGGLGGRGIKRAEIRALFGKLKGKKPVKEWIGKEYTASTGAGC